MTPPHAPLALVPVLDVAAGQLVRAVEGRRDEYRPWTSPLAPTADPAEFVRNATALVERLAASEVATPTYAADLDALQGGTPQWDLWSELAGEYALWCDAGLRTADQLQRMTELVAPRGGRAIVATETAASMAALLDLVAAADPQQVAVSFDWRGARPLSHGGWLTAGAWLDLAGTLYNRGVRSFVVIDLATVGGDAGPSVAERCRQLRQRLPDCQLLAGGGVRHADDADRLVAAGCDGVLAASWLHRLAERGG